MNVFEVLGSFRVDKAGGLADLNEVTGAGQRSANEMDGSFRGMGDSIKSTLATIGTAVAAAFAVTKIIDFGKEAIKQFTDLEAAQSKLFGTMAPISAEQREAIIADIRAIANEYGVAATSVTAAMDTAFDLGVPQEKMHGFMETAVQMSKVLGIDLEQATSTLAKTTQLLGKDFSEADQVANLLFTGVEQGGVDLETMSNALGKISPLAQAMGVDMTQVVAAISSLSAQGIPARTALGGIQAALEELKDPESDVAALFLQLTGQTFPEFITQGGNLADAFTIIADGAAASGQNVTDLFSNVEAGKAVFSTTGEKAESFRAKIDELAGSAVTVSTAYGEMSGTMQEKMARLTEWWSGVQVQIGGQLVTALQPVMDWFSGNGDKIGKILTSIFSVVGQVLDLLVKSGLLDLLVTLLDAVATALGWVFDILGDVAGFIIDTLVGAFNTFMDVARTVVDTVAGWVSTLVDTITGAVDAVKRFFGVSEDLQGISGEAEDFLKKAADSLSKIDQNGADANRQLGYFVDHIQSAVDNGGDLNMVLQTAWQYLDEGKAKYGDLSDATKQWVAEWIEATYGVKVAAYDVGVSVPEGMAEGMTDGTPLVEQAAEDMASAAVETVQEELETHSPSRVMMRIGRDVGQGLADGIQSAQSFIRRVVTDITDSIRTIVDTDFKGALEDIIAGTARYFLEAEQRAQDHRDKVKSINEEEATAISDAAQVRNDAINDLNIAYRNGAISIDEYNAEVGRVLDEYALAQEEAKDRTKTALDEERKAYEATKKTVWEVLKEMTRNVLKALKEDLLLKAAAALAEAIGMTFVLNPAAVGKYAEAAAYGTGAAGLAIAGFARGGIATRELMARLGDTGVHEAVIPLTQVNLGAIGRGIVDALQGPQLAMAGAGGTTYATDMRGLFDGATINVDSPQRVESLAREINTLWETRKRGRGY
jgi:TP901 family phage tail tape measure protein